MIRPIIISPLNTTCDFEYLCENCKYKGKFHLENEIKNTNNNGDLVQPLDLDCPECGAKIEEKNKF